MDRPNLLKGEDLLPEPVQLRSRQKRTRIKAAGLALFGEKGYDRTSVDEITAKAKLATGGFYQHFRSKQQLLLVLMDELLESLSRLDLRPKGASNIREGLRGFLTRGAVGRSPVSRRLSGMARSGYHRCNPGAQRGRNPHLDYRAGLPIFQFAPAIARRTPRRRSQGTGTGNGWIFLEFVGPGCDPRKSRPGSMDRFRHAFDLSRVVRRSTQAQRARLRVAKQQGTPADIRAARLTPCPSCASSQKN